MPPTKILLGRCFHTAVYLFGHDAIIRHQQRFCLADAFILPYSFGRDAIIRHQQRSCLASPLIPLWARCFHVLYSSGHDAITLYANKDFYTAVSSLKFLCKYATNKDFAWQRPYQSVDDSCDAWARFLISIQGDGVLV